MGTGLAGSLTILLDVLAGGRLAPPSTVDSESGTATVTVWPVRLLFEPGRAGQVRVRYLVTGAGPAGTDLAALDRVLPALLADPRLMVVPDPVPEHVWQAFGQPPRPGLLVDVAVYVDRPAAPEPVRVREPLRVDDTALRPLSGTVRGPSSVPLARVRVEAVGAGRATYTDDRGTFTLPGLPATAPVRLRLSVAGRELTAEVDAASTEPVAIVCDFEEE